MDTLKFGEKGKIKMIAHRGASGVELENTCPAFIVAGVKSYFGIETDVQVTLDGKYIIVHDADLKRVAGLDMKIETSTFADLRAVRLINPDGATERADLFLPSLEEYLFLCKKYGKVAVLEMCDIHASKHVEGIAAAVVAAGMFDRTIFIDFSKENLLSLRAAYPNAKAQFLTDTLNEENIAFMLDNNLDADIWYPAITREFVDLMHQNGRVVNAWTVDTVEEATCLRDMGVDMITSNLLE